MPIIPCLRFRACPVQVLPRPPPSPDLPCLFRLFFPPVPRHTIPAMPVLAPPVPPFLIAPFAACLIFPQHCVRCRITPFLPDLIDPIRDFPNPTMTRPNSPCLLLLAYPSFPDPYFPYASLPASTGLSKSYQSPPSSPCHSLPAFPYQS